MSVVFVFFPVWTAPNRQNMPNVQTKDYVSALKHWRVCVVYLVLVLYAKTLGPHESSKALPCSAIIYECIVCPYSWQKAISGLGIMTAWFRPQRLEITNAKHGCFVYIVETDLFDFNQITFGRWWGFLRL